MAVDLPKSAVLDESPDARLDDLAQIIGAYNRVTEKLQSSHEALGAEVERLNRELASTGAQLQRSKQLAALGQMAAGIAHEIRNPLAAIQLYSGMIVEDVSAARRGCDEQSQLAAALENARKIAAAVRGLDAIVHDVLSFARAIKPRTAALRVSEVLHRAIEVQKPAIDAAGVDVHVDPAATGTFILADRDLMHQALLNLILNATQSMSELNTHSRGPRCLDFGVQTDCDQVVLRVSDTGLGVEEGAIERIFDPFFTTRRTGTGLGLAIVFRIIEVHGGSISVSNDPAGGGAIFQLRVPAADGASRGRIGI